MIAKRLNRTCDETHRHTELINGKVKKAQIYPEELCAEILRGKVKVESKKVHWDVCLMSKKEKYRKVNEARGEAVGYMQRRRILEFRSI